MKQGASENQATAAGRKTDAAEFFPWLSDGSGSAAGGSALLARLFQVLGEGVVVVGREGKIRECNGAAERILGLSRDQLLGVASTDPRWRTIRPDGTVFPDEEQPAMVALRTGTAVRGVEMGVETGRGRPTWILINAEPLRLGGDRIDWVVVSFSDITAHKEVQLALAESEGRFRSYLEHATEALFVHDFSGRISAVNRRSCEQLGYTREELLQLSVVDIDPQVTLAQAQEIWRSLRPGAALTLNTRHRCKDGSTVPVEVQIGCFDAQGTRHFIGLVRNTDERRRQEAALRESEARFHSFMQALPGLAFITTADGRPVFVNRRPEAGDDGVPGGLLQRLQTAAADRPPVTAPQLIEDQVAQAGGTRTYLTTRFPIVRENQAPLLGAIAIDVTEHKRAEIELRRLHDRLQRLGDNLPGGYVYQFERRPDGTVAFRFLSAGVVQVHGVEVAEALRDPRVLTDQMIEEERAAWRTRLDESFEKLTRFSAEVRFRPRSGALRWLQLNSSPTRLEDGVVQWDGVAIDVTEAKQAEENRLIQSKLQSTGTLAAGIAHDFNNLLGAIRLNLDVGRAPGVPPERAERCWREIVRAIDSARDLTRKLITFAVGGKPSRQPLAIEPVLRDALAFVSGGPKIETRLTVARDVADVEGDPDQLGQAFRALFQNAQEAMPAGGTLTVEVTDLPVGAPRPANVPPGRHVCIRIRDSGGGIAAESLPRIFDPYFSTKERGAQKGMGLGLTICRSILDRHGGTIAVRSTSDAGTEIELLLPAGAPAPARVAAVSAPAPAPAAASRILVMDDDEGLRRVLEMTLEILGHEVCAVAGGAEAVAEYRAGRERGRRYDALLLDLTVPGGFGALRVLTELRAFDPDVRAIVMSGYSDDVVLHDWAKCGFVAALTKPFDESRLREVLDLALAQAV